jgi:hypothetical protein
MKHLSSAPASSVVYFQSAGLGYYTLQAQNQGLFCSSSRFVVLVDVLPLLNLAMIGGEVWMEDTLAIKDEYMERRAAELAVCDSNFNILGNCRCFVQVST